MLNECFLAKSDLVATWYPDDRTEVTRPLRTPLARMLHGHTITGGNSGGDRPAELRRQTTACPVWVGSQAPLRFTASETLRQQNHDQRNANLADRNSVGIHATCLALSCEGA